MTDARLVTPDKLVPGDRVDLEGDPFLGQEPSAEFEYAEVVEIDAESEKRFGIVLVGYEGFGVVGYPADHEMRVVSDEPVEWEVTITETWRVTARTENDAIERVEEAATGENVGAADLVERDRQAWMLLVDASEIVNPQLPRND